MNVDPERINADHWCEQHFRAATLFIPYLPMQPAQQEIPQRPPGIDANGDPDPNDPGHPGQPALPFIAMRPPIPAVRGQIAVDANYCLRAYLLHTFRKQVDVIAADKFLSTFRTQQPKQTCTAFIDTFITNFEYYITIRWMEAERNTPYFRADAESVRLQYIRDGFCREFKKHLEYKPNITTLQQIDDETQHWARETVEGKEFTDNCNKSEDTRTTAEPYAGRNIPQNDGKEKTNDWLNICQVIPTIKKFFNTMTSGSDRQN